MKPLAHCVTNVTIATVLLSSVAIAAPQNIITYNEPLDILTLPKGKTIHLQVGIGSGACRLSSDPQNVIYTITDRGPNIGTVDGLKLLGTDFSDKKGKIFPTPNFSPTIYKLKVSETRVEVLDKIQLKNSRDLPITGISNPDTEQAWDISGNALPYDQEGIDAEGIAKLSDGTFWIGEEYGPSILHVAAEGRILERWVPEGVKKSLKDAGYPVKEMLPAILRSRALNRGIESMTVSPDERYLYFALQSPLANPDKDAYKTGRAVRVFKISLLAGELAGEYVYQLDSPETFGKDNLRKKRSQNDVKVSELTATGTDKLVVLERISKTTKFYQIDLSQAENILGSRWDNPATKPSLEQDLSRVISPEKTLLLNSDNQQGMMSKIEGMAWMGNDNWIMINDNDFNIAGDATSLIHIAMPVH